jgi:hypothetical protein
MRSPEPNLTASRRSTNGAYSDVTCRFPDGSVRVISQAEFENRRERKNWAGSSVDTRSCEICGNTFTPSTPNRLYCNNACASQARYGPKCLTCGKPLPDGSGKSRKYCRAECKPSYGRKYHNGHR